METRANYILVGLFTLVAGAALLLFALWIADAGTDRDAKYYDVLFRETVSSLSIGSPVQYSGIPVGEVDELTLDPIDPRIVRARIRVLANVPVKLDTIARLTILNITGASAIELGEGSPESPQLTSSSGIPVIEATPSSLAQLRVSSEELLLNASTLLARANELLSDENSLRVSLVLDNVGAFTAELSGQQQILQEGLESLAQSSQSFNELVIHANDVLTRYEDPVLEGATTALTDIKKLSEQMNAMLVENSSAVTAGMQGFAELGPAMSDLRTILTTIEIMTRRISDDPANFVLGNDNIREYQQ